MTGKRRLSMRKAYRERRRLKNAAKFKVSDNVTEAAADLQPCKGTSSTLDAVANSSAGQIHPRASMCTSTTAKDSFPLQELDGQTEIVNTITPDHKEELIIIEEITEEIVEQTDDISRDQQNKLNVEFEELQEVCAEPSSPQIPEDLRPEKVQKMGTRSAIPEPEEVRMENANPEPSILQGIGQNDTDADGYRVVERVESEDPIGSNLDVVDIQYLLEKMIDLDTHSTTKSCNIIDCKITGYEKIGWEKTYKMRCQKCGFETRIECLSPPIPWFSKS